MCCLNHIIAFAAKITPYPGYDGDLVVSGYIGVTMEAFEKVGISITSLALEGLEPFATANSNIIHSAGIIITSAKTCYADKDSFLWHKDASLGADPEVFYKSDFFGRLTT